MPSSKVLLRSLEKLLFLNSGDFLADSDTLNKSVGIVMNNPYVDICYGDILAVNHKVIPQERY